MKIKPWINGICILLLCSLLTACSAPPETGGGEEQTLPAAVTATEEDADSDYIRGFIFFGESTTYHLKNRGVLPDGTDTKQVWGPENGTVNLDTTVTSIKIVYPETGERLTISQALSRKRPKRLLLCFGLNGAVSKHTRGKEYFQACYRLLLDAVQEASPDTDIYLQSAFPVAQNMDMSAYSVDVDTLNSYIRTINAWTNELAAEYGATYLNTAEVLQDDNGRLRMSYQSGDGHHLTAEAYQKILAYIIEHKGENK